MIVNGTIFQNENILLIEVVCFSSSFLVNEACVSNEYRHNDRFLFSTHHLAIESPFPHHSCLATLFDLCFHAIFVVCIYLEYRLCTTRGQWMKFRISQTNLPADNVFKFGNRKFAYSTLICIAIPITRIEHCHRFIDQNAKLILHFRYNEWPLQILNSKHISIVAILKYANRTENVYAFSWMMNVNGL